MKEKLSEGSLVKHKSSNQKMVIVEASTYSDSTINDSYLCRYFNKVNGKYEMERFKPIELVELAGRTE